jgi:hypothetical protein
MITFIDRKKVRKKRDFGYCYRIAGFEPCGETKSGLLALQLLPNKMPPAYKGIKMSTHLQEVGASEAQKMGPTDQDLIEKYLEIKAYVEQQEKELSDRLKPARDGMELIKNTLLAWLNERGADNTKTESGTAYKSRILDVKVIGRQEFLDFALQQNPDMLQVGAVKDAVKDFIAEHERTPPGLETSTTIRINIRRS